MDTRVKLLKDLKRNKNGEYILYWMQQSQRIEYNHAFNYAVEKANKFNLPLVVAFGLSNYPEANERHYYFMLEGLIEVKNKLEAMGVKFVLKLESPPKLIYELSQRASIVVTDMAYLKIGRSWRKELINIISVPLIQVESDLIVPIEVASNKEEYAAYTIRKKINRNLDDYLFPMELPKIQKNSLDLNIESENLDSIEKLLEALVLNKSVTKVEAIKGGYSEAKRKLEVFIDEKLDKYNELKNDPSLEYTSTLSPYLHFGQISPIEIALAIKESECDKDSVASFLEELIIRRELAFNFCYYNENYDNYKGLKVNWIYETLEKHKEDEREYLYSLDELENAATHDAIWNACQKELLYTGDMHGYMRMYWGKKILEWSLLPEEAFERAVYLNNKYALDGRDPNSYTGIAWCFGKHDRPWFEREIFGKVRYMNDKGLKRKFKVDLYIDRIEALVDK